MTWTQTPDASSPPSVSIFPFQTTKRLLFLRHGQALHNPRAEEAKDRGCSHETFLQLMKEDDAFDAELTSLGETQAIMAREKYLDKLQNVQLVVSSPLSRAIQTANLVMIQQEQQQQQTTTAAKRVCVELFREINGWLLNAKRRTKTDLQGRFHSPSWDFSGLSMDDETWTETLESEESCAERYYQGLLWLLRDREEEVILTVAHGGLLRFGMVDHPNVHVVDKRGKDQRRFGNCELREYEAHVAVEVTGKEAVVTQDRPLILLREIHSIQN
eukprot:CAMPEP_0176482794 /NCGR_PEP_ID=MMETSP0200_2-20121128/3567_1 /TAXON_ID=947934 /ORGANISM="Chaetoceros sp., Strain GSL56" /LENGTH=271 /DNA_ID=CAMNT_0017879137 /DNA_START=151 /DNA_END=966 /DNA_ORIENTATION=-